MYDDFFFHKAIHDQKPFLAFQKNIDEKFRKNTIPFSFSTQSSCYFNAVGRLVPLKSLLATLLLLLFVWSGSYAQATRNNYGARLELNNVILHGAGQDPVAFQEYFDHMAVENKPNLYMYYIALEDIEDEFWVTDLLKQLNRYPNHFMLPQIGISMTDGNNPDSNYEGEVAAGVFDDQIDHLVQGLKKLGRPAYLRIGYEFNGLAWNGYEANTYVAAFQRITDAIRLAELEVATVWCAVFGGGTDSDYQSYYPGDDYVDWWAIDLFSVTDFSEPLVSKFMADAHSARKPVMIGETTPRFIGADDAIDWTDWFTHYYAFIEDNPGVKATCYINWNWPEWTDFPQWSDWGNAKLSANDFVRVNFVHRLRQNPYVRAIDHESFRRSLSYNDESAPSGVAIEAKEINKLPIDLVWAPVFDESGVVYEIYKNGALYATSYDTAFTDYQYAAGQNNSYTVRAMDWAGNGSDRSNTLNYSLGDTIQKTVNALFQGDIFPWSLDNYSGASSRFDLSGNGIDIEIDNSTSINWQIQFIQEFNMLEQNKYFINGRVSASPSGPAAMTIQQNEPPFALPIFLPVTLNPDVTSFTTTTYTAPEDDDMMMGLFLGELNTGTTITIDEFTLFEINGREYFTPNEPPLANAGDDILYTTANQPLALNGSASSDTDGMITRYHWEQLSGLQLLDVQNSDAATSSILKPETGEYVFRLTIMDNQGATSMDEIMVTIDTSQITSVNVPAHYIPVRVWPNPFSDLVFVALPGENLVDDLTIQVFDLQGKRVNDQAMKNFSFNNGSLTLNMNRLAPGAYLVRIGTTEKVYLGQVIKQ